MIDTWLCSQDAVNKTTDVDNLHKVELQQQARQRRIKEVCGSKVKPEEFSPYYFMSDPNITVMQVRNTWPQALTENVRNCQLE